MHLRLDHHSGEPIYLQIVEQIKYAVASGRLNGDEQLPSIRALAGELKINPRTVVKAYEELQHAGLVVMQQGKGVFVTLNRQGAPAGVRRRIVAELARRMLSEAARMGAEPDEVRAILEDEAHKMESDE